MAKDPFEAFADPISDEDFASFADPVDDPVASNAELQRRFDAGDALPELQAYAQTSGLSVTPEEWDAAAKARAAGRGVAFKSDAPSEIAPETVGQAIYRGVGDVAAGVGDVLGLIGNPLNAGINAVAGTNLSTDLGQTLRDWTGAPEAITGTERYLSAAARGGSAALTGAGLAAPLAGANGMTGFVSREVAGAPSRDLAAGVAGALGAEGGGDAGEAVGGGAGRVAGTLAGGLAGGISGARAAEVAAAKFIARVPPEVAIDASGNLTPDGHEMALRAGVDEDEVRRAYARVRKTRFPDRAPPAERHARRESARASAPQAEVDIILNDGTSVSTPRAEAPQAPLRIGQETGAIEAEIQRRLRSGEAFDGPNSPPPPPRDNFTEAREEGVQLSRGQSEQDFEVQNDENSLRVSATRQGEQARGFFRQQQQQMQGAVQRFRQAFGEDPGGAADRGERLQQAVRELRDSGAEGVRQLYRQAEELGGEGLRLDHAPIREAAIDVLIDEGTPEGVKRAVSQELARYGIIGEAGPTNEAGLTKVALDDGSSVSFRGPVKDLTAANAEDLRKAINRLYDPTKPNMSGQSIKPAIDQALEDALAGASQLEGGIGNAYQSARQAYRDQKQTFAAKDIIESLVSNKRGTDTPVLLPERAIAQTIGAGKSGVTNLRKVRALLLSSGTDSSRQAWRAIQHQGLADIFDAATVRNANMGGEEIEAISGAKLRTAIFEKFGVDKLRVLLGQDEFDRLMKLQRVIGAATIPISGTTNPSGTFTKLVNYMKTGVLRAAAPIPGVGGAVNAFAGLAAKGKEIAATQKTLAGITAYDGRRATGERLDRQAREFVRDYIESGRSGKLVPTSVNLTATQASGRGGTDD